MKYRVGDKVKILRANIPGKAVFVGLTSIITKVNPNGNRYTDIYGEHYSLDISKRFVFHTDEIKVIPNKIVITTDGSETLARLYEGNKVIKSATAKCSPDDTFDAIVGAKIAFDRLIEEEKKREYKVGQIYRVDGALKHAKGEIKIKAVRGENIDYDIVAGMNGWSTNTFMRGSAFAEWLTLVEEEPKIKIGDKVEVIHNGHGYTTNHKWFERNAPELAIYYSYNHNVANGAYGVVRKIAYDGDRRLCAIEVKGEHGLSSIYLIWEKGIKKVEG